MANRILGETGSDYVERANEVASSACWLKPGRQRRRYTESPSTREITMAGLTQHPQPTAITVHQQSRVLEVVLPTARRSASRSS